MPTPAQDRTRTFTNAVIAAVALSLLLASLSSGWVEPYFATRKDLAEGILRGLCLLLAFATCIWLRWRTRAPGQRNDALGVRLGQPGLKWLQGAQEAGGRQISNEDIGAVAGFVEFIINPECYRTRVAENVDFEGRTIVQSVSVELVVPREASAANTIYVPLLQPMKGDLVDNFSLRDATGGSLVVLSYDDTISLAAVGLRLLITEARGRPGRGPHRLDDNVRAIELALLRMIARRGTSDGERVKKRIDNAINRLAISSTEGRERLHKYLLALSLAYPIVAVVPSDSLVDNRALLKYGRSILPASEKNGIAGLVRIGLGLRPHQIRLPINLAFTGGSYHLRVNGPPNAYVRMQQLRCRHCGQLAPVKRPRASAAQSEEVAACSHNEARAYPEDTYLRVRRRRGQSFVHVYTRGLAKAPRLLRDLELLIEFKEIPPGTRGRAVITAMVTTLLIGAIGYLVTRRGGPTDDGDIGALLLALPAVAASWFGLTSDTYSFFGSSLLARLSLAASGLLSAASIAVYFVHEIDRSWGFYVLGINDPLWILLGAVSVANFACITYRFVVKLLQYNALLQKEDQRSQEQEIFAFA